MKKAESSISRLTRWSVTYSLPAKGSQNPKQDGDKTIYGVDAEGNEKVYAQVPPNRWEKWAKADPLWKQAQSKIFDHLLSDPRTRDFVVMINIQAAVRKGDRKTAVKLWNALSESAKAKLMDKPETK